MSHGRVRRRTWTKRGPTGHQIRVTSWGFTVQANGKQQRRFNADWTKESAREALAKFLLQRDQQKTKPITFATAGTYKITCTIHPYMEVTVDVTA